MAKSYLQDAEHYEAREWLAGNPHPGPLGPRFGEKKNAVRFVDKLYTAGAKSVFVLGPIDDCDEQKGGAYTDTLVVVLPADKEKRKKLFNIHKKEAVNEGCNAQKDAGQKELFFWWD